MIVYLNGAFVPLESASVSPLDRGFLFGDGIYEVIPSYGGEFFLLEEHIARLRRSLHEIRMPEPEPDQGWTGILRTLLELNPGGDRSVYLQVTRGAAPRDHAFPAHVAATVFAMVSAIPAPTSQMAERGVAAITLQDQRWGRCDIKAIALLPNVLARQQAIEQGAVEAILLRDGLLTEGAASNVFVVRGASVITPPLGHAILPGITRAFLVQALLDAGWDCREEPVSGSALQSADEIWLTSSTKEILPVTSVDGRPVGEGRPGPVWRRALEAFRVARSRSMKAKGSGAR